VARPAYTSFITVHHGAVSKAVMSARSVTIRTPDQRVRVFVSSTMQELAAERNAAVEAIRSLKLTPVLFELGARPHPPRDLYRAYLQQSPVFVGVYGEQYGGWRTSARWRAVAGSWRSCDCPCRRAPIERRRSRFLTGR
jgi:hypothetical protein